MWRCLRCSGARRIGGALGWGRAGFVVWLGALLEDIVGGDESGVTEVEAPGGECGVLVSGGVEAGCGQVVVLGDEDLGEVVDAVGVGGIAQRVVAFECEVGGFVRVVDPAGLLGDESGVDFGKIDVFGIEEAEGEVGAGAVGEVGLGPVGAVLGFGEGAEFVFGGFAESG